MFFKLGKNVKGFTLIEMVVVIAIMAILVGFTVPNVDKAIERRERSSAESDTQEIFRFAISAVTDLKSQNVRPNFATVSENEYYDAVYATKLTTLLYETIMVLDIRMVFWDGNEDKIYQPPASDGSAGVADGVYANVPAGFTPEGRAKMMSGGNKNPYVVISVRISEPEHKQAILTVSYHNASNRFKINVDTNFFDVDSAYKTNSNKPIVYNFLIEDIDNRNN
ncbi:MAG: prepilin-type N-terminal cleavage/methylation domain-containing protein [Clostridia bacterium]